MAMSESEALAKTLSLLKESREKMERHLADAKAVRQMVQRLRPDLKSDRDHDLIEAVAILLGLVEIQWQMIQESKDIYEKIKAAVEKP